mmetsp:Transcript_7518/g.26830  ORF Transcript_7518/g.26830 Transcript_7518/m.26830 type:complete len:111 (-) Transcript_7518:452-784(-)
MEDVDDVLMRSWTGTIIGPMNTAHDGRIYGLKIYCDLDYPKKPPKVRFLTKINMNCVDSRNGNVIPSAFHVLGRWKMNYRIETVLVELRREMASSSNRKLAQPTEGSSYE